MVDLMKPIEQQLELVYKAAKELLMGAFPNLYFFVSPTGKLTSWVRTKDGRDGAGIQMKYEIHVGSILCHHWRYLEELNEYVTPVHNEPDKYFYCTECGRVQKIEQFEHSVFAGYYCKECAKKPEVAKLIAESHTRGFYD